MSDYGDIKDDDDPAVALAKNEIKMTSRQLVSYRSERDRLKTEIERCQMSQAEKEALMAKAAKLHAVMLDADQETVRYFIDRLSVMCQLEYGAADERLIHITCELTAEEGVSIRLPGC